MRTELSETSVFLKEQAPGLDTWVASFAPNEERAFRLLYSSESNLPLIHADESRVVLFAGRLQNRDPLLASLNGSIPSDSTDAEVILLLYLKFGESLLDKIRGIYVLIIWDRERKRFLCARDRCGVYPIFHTEVAGQFLISLCAQDLIRQPQVSRSINRVLIIEHFSQRRPFPEETFFSSVKRILPGHALKIVNGQKSIFRYWYSFPQDGNVDWISTEDGVDQFDDRFEEAVKRCTAPGTAGIFLSGGLDSVSVASLAVDVARRNGRALPQAFSLVFPHPDCNEEQLQKSVADQLGIQQTLLPVNQIMPKDGLLWSALELAKSWSQPMWNCWKPLYLHLGKEAKEKGCHVILTGGGGDDWLTVNPNYAADLIRYLNISGLKQFVSTMLRSYKGPKTAQVRYFLWKSGIRPLLGLYARKSARLTPSMYRKYLAARIPPILAWMAPDPELRREVDRREEILLQQLMQAQEPSGRYGFYKRSFSNYFINTVASMEMETEFESWPKIGMPILYPYFDSDLIELLLRITPELLQRAGMEKGIVRDAVARRFPDLRFDRQKKVTAIRYFQSLIREEGPVAWDRLGGIDSLIRYGIVNRNAVESIREGGFIGQNPSLNHGIWNLISMEAWLRTRE